MTGAVWANVSVGTATTSVTQWFPVLTSTTTAGMWTDDFAIYVPAGNTVEKSRHLHAGEYYLPDGSMLVIEDAGNYKILDEAAQVVYRACRIREFNPYINASDLLEAFIREVGHYDEVDQSDVLRLPIEAFINWIILQAAKRDGDPLDDLPSVQSALLPAKGISDALKE